jgi:hypothetical protein
MNKTAWNDTQNKDATTVAAKPGDKITYIMTVNNIGDGAVANYALADDVRDVRTLANLIDIDGATLQSNDVLVYPSVSIAAHTVIRRAFIVQVKKPLPTGIDCIMTNVFGNTTVNVKVDCSTPFLAPPTGATTTWSFILAGLTLVGFAGYRSGKFNFVRKGVPNV